jgi:outer membrane protein assembly factor BamB
MAPLQNLILILAALASPPVVAANWPEFRGPTANGCSSATGLPVRWSESENIGWKTRIHGRGWSSPVIWGDQVWVTTAPEDGRQAYAVAVDLNRGHIVHNIKVFDVPQPQPIEPFNSYASPTPAIEAGRVYVHFGAHGTACLDTRSGKILWTRRDLPCNHYRGPGSSPILIDDLLIVHFDGIDLDYVVAFDKHSGKTVWKTDRSTDFTGVDGDLRKAYATPTVIRVGAQRQLISPASRAAMAYDPLTGRELWKICFPAYSSPARPVCGAGLVFFQTGFGADAEVLAVRPDGRGDVTDTHIAWRLGKYTPNKPSPLFADGLLYLTNEHGIASCLEAGSGKLVWQQRLRGRQTASPLWADGRVYFFSQEGKTSVVQAGRTFQLLAENRLDDGFLASPAVAGKALILRTKTRLLRVENTPPLVRPPAVGDNP